MDTKLSAYMKKAFAIMGSIEELLQQKKNVQELPTNSFDKPFKWLLKVLNVPFVDIETEGLVILRSKSIYLFHLLNCHRHIEI